MPHIVFDKRIELDDFSNKFLPIYEKDDIIIKISTIFVEKNKLTALLPATVISNINQQFLIEISTKKAKTTIRLYPETDPKKTEGVKMALALLAKQILCQYPEFSILKTNLSNHLKIVHVIQKQLI